LLAATVRCKARLSTAERSAPPLDDPDDIPLLPLLPVTSAAAVFTAPGAVITGVSTVPPDPKTVDIDMAINHKIDFSLPIIPLVPFFRLLTSFFYLM
jgi:hypothetical protein